MAVRASSSKAIDALIADLGTGDSIARDAAIARLTIIGSRAVDRIITFLQHRDTSPAGRVASLRALEAIGDRRAISPALTALGGTYAAVAVAAVDSLRPYLRTGDGAAIIDRLTATALDRKRPTAIRVAVLRALRDLDAKTIAPLMKSLSGDTDTAVRQEATGSTRTAAPERGPDPSQASLQNLHALIEELREREAAAAGIRRRELAAQRAKVHLELARRGSRIALYDLRESLERSRDPLPVDALAALSRLGDASCLEPIAAAYTRSTDGWSRNQLLSMFHAIVKREKLTARSAVMKRIAKRWPALAQTLG